MSHDPDPADDPMTRCASALERIAAALEAYNKANAPPVCIAPDTGTCTVNAPWINCPLHAPMARARAAERKKTT